ncbi:hypothetical protein [Chryseobacterium shandongense]|uniref:hypothetical protein n=1 Tax=Chryseobacterium shandongense TaxID=1493872 RepID=UPI000F513DE3|nr:hypothetical protein [Chryseobacterium shandongense]AZA58594.1 hypothetical protein EG350_16005 [Chryseobacterium shandongense]
MKNFFLSIAMICTLSLIAQKTKTRSPQTTLQKDSEKEVFTFCYENFTVDLVNDGNGYAEMKRYSYDGRLVSLTPGKWKISKNYGYNDVYIKWRGSDNTFKYLLIIDGNGFVSKLIDNMSRDMTRCN